MNNDILAKPCCKKCGLLCQVEPGQKPPKPCGYHKPCACKRKKPCCDRGLMKVVISASLGDDTDGQDKPSNGAYTDAIVTYEANGAQYIYDKNGAFTKVAGGGVSKDVEFDDVLGRPKYANIEMTSETDIPDVPLSASGGKKLNDIIMGTTTESYTPLAWIAAGTGSSYTKRALQVTLNISETNLTIPGDTWTSLGITLPANFRPTITMLGSVAANNSGIFEAGLIRVNTDGTVEVHTSGATTDIYGSITFPVSA